MTNCETIQKSHNSGLINKKTKMKDKYNRIEPTSNSNLGLQTEL